MVLKWGSTVATSTPELLQTTNLETMVIVECASRDLSVIHLIIAAELAVVVPGECSFRVWCDWGTSFQLQKQVRLLAAARQIHRRMQLHLMGGALRLLLLDKVVDRWRNLVVNRIAWSLVEAYLLLVLVGVVRLATWAASVVMLVGTRHELGEKLRLLRVEMPCLLLVVGSLGLLPLNGADTPE